MKHETKLKLGQVIFTKAVSNKMDSDYNFDRFVKTSLRRFSNKDWGDIWLNEQALANGERVLAAYSRHNDTIWIITEADRSVTTIMFPSEY